jgi:hypothetical protein
MHWIQLFLWWIILLYSKRRSLSNGTFYLLESIKQEQDSLKEHY